MGLKSLAGSLSLLLAYALAGSCSVANAAFVPSTSISRVDNGIVGVNTNNINTPFYRHPQSNNNNRRSTASSPLYLKKGGTKKKKVKSNTITVNKLAFRNYEVLETLEVGISLLGTEVKSIRDGKMNIRDGFVKPDKNGRSCSLHNIHIGKHATAGEFFQHDERRPRDLLLHKAESRRLLQKTDRTPGMTIVPLKAYWKNNGRNVKFQIGLCRGKNVRDKRQDIKEREGKREANRMIKNFNFR